MRKKKKKLGVRPGLVRSILILAIIATALTLTLIPGVWSFLAKYLPFIEEPRQTTPADGDMAVHFLDVGQGDCSLIIMPSGEAMLIDTSTKDQADVILEYISYYKIKKLDYLVLTHPHADHIGSAPKIIKSLDIGTILMPDATTTTKIFEETLNAIDSKNLEITIPKPGEEFKLGKASITVLGPTKDTNDLNNMSIVLRLDYGKTSFLFTGDAEHPSEEDMLKVNKASAFKADVIKLGHHGSSTSSSDDFLSAVDPDYAVISCGKDNSYGHPHTEIIKSLQKKNITYYRTDEKGNIVFSSDGKKVSLLRPTA